MTDECFLPSEESDTVDPYLNFFLEHIDPKFSSDTNSDIGPMFVGLAYPSVVIIGSFPDFLRCEVDVLQPDFDVEPDRYPLKEFLEQFPCVCRELVESHHELKNTYLRWAGKAGC